MISAVTPEQLKLFNDTRPKKILCAIFGHRMGRVAKLMPIRKAGKMKQCHVLSCQRCTRVKVIGVAR